MTTKVPPFLKNNPFRSPQWRYERARYLTTNNKTPDYYDDTFVRDYRKFLLLKRSKTGLGPYLEFPHVYIADAVHNHPDVEWRDILQARLLTPENYSEIAERFSMDEKAVEFYEGLFFNVRDRMQNKDWIAKVIVGTPESRVSNKMGTMTASQRGMVYRLFAYYGGPEVLDAMITGMIRSALPTNSKDLDKWFEVSISQILNTRAAQAAKTMQINKFNIMQILELSMAKIYEKNANTPPGQSSFEEFAGQVTEAIGVWGMAEDNLPKDKSNLKFLTGPVEPRVAEWIDMQNGIVPETFDESEQHVDWERIRAAGIKKAEEKKVKEE